MNVSYRYVDRYTVPDDSFLLQLAGTVPVRSYDRLDLRATVEIGDWSISGYVHNVLYDFDYANIRYNPFVAEMPDNLLVTPLEPRACGVAVSKGV